MTWGNTLSTFHLDPLQIYELRAQLWVDLPFDELQKNLQTLTRGTLNTSIIKDLMNVLWLSDLGYARILEALGNREEAHKLYQQIVTYGKLDEQEKALQQLVQRQK
jgi:tetratricopeptide (TPR) repeat protein